tara:strand:+ start:321 stop:962 length:642 start_codon:yes stop_codon:yes gene_type:complete
MDKKMKIDVKILNEVMRYKSINNYISEQDATLPPPPDATLPPPDAGAVPPPPDAGVPESVDISTDPDVEKIGGESKKSKELDITDLVKSQQSVEKKQEEYFDNLFKHLEGLESKLSDMDSIMNKLNDLETKVEKYRVKTPEEKLELRSLDSGPFNQKLTDFFEDKQEDMEKSGKNEYVLTKDDVESYSPGDIKKSFRNFENTDTDIDTFSRLK